MKKQKLFTFLFIFLIIVVVAAIISLFFWLRSESVNCIKDPIQWFEEKNEGAECICYKDGVVWPETQTTNGQDLDYSFNYSELDTFKNK